MWTKGGRGAEAAPGFEPGNGGFADLCLTTWLCRRRTLVAAAQPTMGQWRDNVPSCVSLFPGRKRTPWQRSRNVQLTTAQQPTASRCDARDTPAKEPGLLPS